VPAPIFVEAGGEAITIAEARGLDLVEVAPTARPPGCKIMDYGKFKYEQAKKAKKASQAKIRSAPKSASEHKEEKKTLREDLSATYDRLNAR